MNLIAFYICLLISQFAFSQRTLDSIYKLDKDKIAILKNSKYENDTRYLSLQIKDLALVEEVLSKCINDHNKKIDSSKNSYEFMRLGNYRRQYIPYYKNGQKYVWVNCFCDDVRHFSYWRKKPVTVFDGGNCFFNVLINLSTKQYLNLYINGIG